MCGYMAPALVTSPTDLITYHISTSDPVESLPHPGYSERFIRKFPLSCETSLLSVAGCRCFLGECLWTMRVSIQLKRPSWYKQQDDSLTVLSNLPLLWLHGFSSVRLAH